MPSTNKIEVKRVRSVLDKILAKQNDRFEPKLTNDHFQQLMKFKEKLDLCAQNQDLDKAAKIIIEIDTFMENIAIEAKEEILKSLPSG